MTDADICIVGGGPSGAAAAIVAARAGRRVLVVDKAQFPRDKTCGDGLTTWCLRQLEQLGLDPTTVPSFTPVGQVHVVSPSGRTGTFAFEQAKGGAPRGWYSAVARRIDLDASLLALAADAGATVLEQHRCTGARADGDTIVADLEGPNGEVHQVRAAWLVGADGMWSPTRQFLGTARPGYRGEWHAFRQYLVGVDGPAATDQFVWLEPDLLPGYAWSFPVGPESGTVNVGIALRRDRRWRTGAMAALWDEVLTRPHLRAALGPAARPEGPHRAWPIPAAPDTPIAARGRALWVGDAMAATDLMTGEGIAQALATGRWAAEAVLAAGDGPGAPAAAAAAYGASIAEHLVPDHRMAQLLDRALQHRKGARAAVWVASRTPWTRRHFVRWMFEDSPRGLLFTPARWRRGALSADGAFAER
jgi:menaquinone-9 beta-reductase